eukprot:1158274-Pelagomonas_calceolata.AAC.56
MKCEPRLPPHLCDVHRSAEGVGQLELVCLNGHDLQDGELCDQHLGVLACEVAVYVVPSRTL